MTYGLPNPKCLVSKSTASSPYRSAEVFIDNYIRPLHQAGNEVAWWETLNNDALAIASAPLEAKCHPPRTQSGTSINIPNLASSIAT